MHILDLHSWDVEIPRAREIQQELRSRVSLRNALYVRKIRWLAGADVSYTQGDKKLYGAVVLLSFPDLAVVEERWAAKRASFPYVPGFLSFREAPVVLEAFARLRRRPDAVIFDGQGIAHPRGLGLASHVALFLDLPSVGCAKSKLVGEYCPMGMKRKSFSWLEFQGKRVGVVLRTRMNVKPVFVSPGHRVDNCSAMELILAACRGYRLPEPVRMAHRLVNRVRREDR
ncbi:MAG: deoxyribonuclease V [Candidatus Binatia bacterium]|nr:deoxyribonuclease V [Candidatus Binatia bacterium]